ncbi:predicted protein [Streptomyces viridosporus ATCC 14672]|uniref:Predicted protein n=1 Tax=Streptomyces viridosporus (strain ATCC 14672 / DSM 40746 / JCM 4963 / KCTC 9882 / NRRL B-12104 / FH 1290) TaxID=566461 RepID=D5ZSS9_STRV1|nr:predicted protein [Streptomyces viridosporus ATCC 14672]
MATCEDASADSGGSRVNGLDESVGVGVEQWLHLLVVGLFVLLEPVDDVVPVLARCAPAKPLLHLRRPRAPPSPPTSAPGSPPANRDSPHAFPKPGTISNTRRQPATTGVCIGGMTDVREVGAWP